MNAHNNYKTYSISHLCLIKISLKNNLPFTPHKNVKIDGDNEK